MTKTFHVTVTVAGGRTFRTALRARDAQRALDMAIGNLTRRGYRPTRAHAAQLVWTL